MPKFEPGAEVKLIWKKDGVVACGITGMAGYDGRVDTIVDAARNRTPCHHNCPTSCRLYRIRGIPGHLKHWPETHMELVESAKGGAEAPEKEEKEMSKVTSWAYEIILPGAAEKDGCPGREPVMVAHGEGLLTEPTDADLLVKHAKDIIELGVTGSAVQVNRRPFLH